MSRRIGVRLHREASSASAGSAVGRRAGIAAVGAVALTSAIAAGTVSWIALESRGGLSRTDAAGDAIIAVGAVLFAVGGSWIVRRAGNRVGLVFAGAGVGAAITALSDAVLKSAPRSPLPEWLAWFALLAILGPLVAVGALSILFLIFPTGTIPSRRWRWAARLWVVGVLSAFVATLVAPGPMSGEIPGLVNPLGVSGLGSLWGFLARVAGVALLAVVLLGVASLVVRARRGGPEVRAQVRWLGFAGGVAVVFFLLSGLGGGSVAVANVAWFVFLATLIFGIPGAVAIAVLKYRLYDIDVVVSKTIVFGALAGFISLVYVAVVVGLGAIWGDAHDPTLSIAATIAIALAFAPVRTRVRRFANRLVYGERATPYEVMAGFSKRVAGTLSVEEVLPGMAEAAANGIGARVAQVRVLATEGERVVRWPSDADAPASWDRSLEIRHQGEQVGWIDVAKEANDPLTAAEARLLEDLASQAGLALHNVRLTDELALRTAEVAEQTERLAASRQRLVAARDEQRRRLEREISEGAAARLRDIGHDLERARRLSEEDPAQAAELLDRLGERSNATLEALRDLARGIFPPLLVDKGVVVALEAHVRKVDADARVVASPSFAEQRFDPDVEACLYFCCLQAIQNVLRHAGNAPTTVRLDALEDDVTFEVADEGPGFDPDTTPQGAGRAIIRDRVEALDGVLDVRTERGRGTVVAGRLPRKVAVPA